MDFSTISSAISAINDAISGANGIRSLFKSLLPGRDVVLTPEVERVLHDKLLSISQHAGEVSAALHVLREKDFESTEEIRKLNEALVDRSGYTLVGVFDRQFAYRKNATPTPGGASAPEFTEPEHYVCQQCFDRPPLYAKVVLQFTPRTETALAYWGCPGCGGKLTDYAGGFAPGTGIGVGYIKSYEPYQN